jgi:hypothetical protein
LDRGLPELAVQAKRKGVKIPEMERCQRYHPHRQLQISGRFLSAFRIAGFNHHRQRSFRVCFSLLPFPHKFETSNTPTKHIGYETLCEIWNALTLHNLDRAVEPERRNKKPEKFGTPPSVAAFYV